MVQNARTRREVTSACARRTGSVCTVRKGRTIATVQCRRNSAATACVLINRRWLATRAFAIRSVSPGWTNVRNYRVHTIVFLYFIKGLDYGRRTKSGLYERRGRMQGKQAHVLGKPTGRVQKHQRIVYLWKLSYR
jgi:hypothetical protein